MLHNVEFSIHRDFMRGSIDIIAWNERGCFVPGPDGSVVLMELEMGQMGKPLMTFSHRGTESLQALADALATFGVMPKVSDHAKELTATKAHLEDMRRMANKAFDALIMPSVQHVSLSGGPSPLEAP